MRLILCENNSLKQFTPDTACVQTTYNCPRFCFRELGSFCAQATIFCSKVKVKVGKGGATLLRQPELLSVFA